MGRLNAISLYTEVPETLICRLAEMAGILRSARHAGVAMPRLCLLGCDSHHWTRWGSGEVCTNCGTGVHEAELWHQVLTTALRQVVLGEQEDAAA